MIKWAGSHGVWKTSQAVHVEIAREFFAVLKDTYMCPVLIYNHVFWRFQFNLRFTGRNFDLDDHPKNSFWNDLYGKENFFGIM